MSHSVELVYVVHNISSKSVDENVMIKVFNHISHRLSSPKSLQLLI